MNLSEAIVGIVDIKEREINDLKYLMRFVYRTKKIEREKN